jgi:spore coat polysaccharide biosynthesis protein SpsF
MSRPASSPERAGGTSTVPAVAIIVQARMTSTRLPGKVMAPIFDRPMLGFQLERLARVATPHVTVVATTTNAGDDPVAELAEAMGCVVFRGSEDDVLGRYRAAAAAVEARVVVRVTSDCPLIDPEVVDAVIERFQAGGCDYASNTLVRTYPRGLDTEVFSRSLLETADREAVDAAEREHVTLFMYRRPDRFRLCSVEAAMDLSAHRWTVDEPADLEFVRAVFAALYGRSPAFSMADVVDLEERLPDLSDLNVGVRQKRVG